LRAVKRPGWPRRADARGLGGHDATRTNSPTIVRSLTSSGRMAAVYEPAGQPWSGVESGGRSITHPLDAVSEQAYIPSRWRYGFGGTAMASVSLRDLGLDRLSIEERLQVADAIWDSVVHEVETSPLPEWQRAELERRLADSVANPDAVRPWSDVEAEALARAKR